MSKVLRGGMYFIIVQGVGLLAGIITSRVLALYLLPEGYGAYGLIVSFTIIVSTVLTAGIPVAASRFIAVNPDRILWIRERISSMQGRFTVVVLLSYLMASPFVAAWLLPSDEAGAVLIAAAMIPVEAFNILYLNLLNGLKEYHKQGNARLVYFSAKAFFSVALVLLGYRLGGAITGFVMGSFFSLLVEHFYWRRSIIGLNEQSSEGLDDFGNKVLSFAAPLVVYSTLNMVLMSIDVFFVKELLDFYFSGIYFAAKNIAQLPWQVLIAAAAAVFPAMSEIHEKRESGEFQFYSTLTMRYIFLTIMPSILFMTVFADNLILLIYDTGYLLGGPTLKLLSIAFLCSVASSFTMTLLISTGNTLDIVVVVLSSIAVQTVGCVLLIPIYSIAGAGYSWIISALVTFILLSAILTRKEGKIIPWMHLAKCILSISIAYLAYMFTTGLNIYLAFGVAIGMYGLLVLLTRAASIEDAKYLLRSIGG
ncbi:MAG: oligosaccharide flippase family protein [Promethearchaeota archaeon]